MTDQSADILKNSVTAGDYSDNPRGGAMLFMLPAWRYDQGAMLPEPPVYWSQERDFHLSRTILHEDLWAGALAIAVTKMSSLSWEVNGDIPLRVKRAQELLQGADLGKGWTSFLAKHLQNFLSTDNGAFVEIVRATSSLNSQILGFVHLDSLRCQRTGDPEIPVIYRDRKGREHELQAHEVIFFADMPDPAEMWFGVGHCAASRCYKTIYKQHAIETYISEKVSGRRPLAVHFVNGMNAVQLQSVLDTAQTAADQRGVIAYMGAIIATIPGEKPPEVATVPLAELPDGYDRKEETDLTLLTYADNIGLDPQDLQPLTGAALGTGAQSAVLDNKAEGKGLAAWRQAFTHAFNNFIIPDLTTFAFVEKDYRDKEQRGRANKAIGDYVDISIKNGSLSAAQGLQVMVDENIYPKEFLPQDVTPDTSLSDAEKPDEGAPAEDQAALPVPAPAQVPQQNPLPVVQKQASDPDELIAAEMEAARKIYEEAN